MTVHGPALKFHTKLTQRMILSDSAFKYFLSKESIYLSMASPIWPQCGLHRLPYFMMYTLLVSAKSCDGASYLPVSYKTNVEIMPSACKMNKSSFF